MEIRRDNYLDKLIARKHNGFIKVITGVRRSGKSKLLETFKRYVNKNVKDSNIIHINFNLAKFENLKDYHALNSYIESNYAEGKENFVLFNFTPSTMGSYVFFF